MNFPRENPKIVENVTPYSINTVDIRGCRGLALYFATFSVIKKRNARTYEGLYMRYDVSHFFQVSDEIAFSVKKLTEDLQHTHARLHLKKNPIYGYIRAMYACMYASSMYVYVCIYLFMYRYADIFMTTCCRKIKVS